MGYTPTSHQPTYPASTIPRPVLLSALEKERVKQTFRVVWAWSTEASMCWLLLISSPRSDEHFCLATSMSWILTSVMRMKPQSPHVTYSYSFLQRIPAPTPTRSWLVLCARAYAGEQEPGALWGSLVPCWEDRWELQAVGNEAGAEVPLSQQGAGPGEGLIHSSQILLFCPG